MGTLVFISALLLSVSVFAQTGVTYHGRLIAPSGVPVMSSLVRFKIQIRSPGAENCLLFEEEQVQDLSVTNGAFALDIGSTPSYRKDTTGLSFDRIFSNQASFNVPGNCVLGNSYAPGFADARKIEVSFNDGSFVGWEPMPTQAINYVPKALDSLQVGGFRAEHLLRVENSGVPQSVPSMTSAQFNEMMSLITGTTSQYTKSGQLGGVSLPSLSGGQVLGWNGSTWMGVTPLTSYTETDPTVQAFAKTTLPTCLAGEVLKSNGSSLSCVTDTTGAAPADATTSSKGIVQISATGGIDVNAGVIQLSDTGTAGTYYKVTTDAKGRVTSGAASLIEADIPNLTTAGKVSGSAINAGTIGGSTTINTSGNITTSGSVTGTTSVTTQNLRIFESTNTYRVNLSAHSTLSANYGLVLPPALPGVSGQVLSSDTSGNLSWSSPSTGSVTSVSGTAPISVTGTSTPTVSIAQAGSASNGYLSSTDWNTFNNKLGTSSSLSGDVTGTPSATTIANNAVNSAKIADGSVGVVDLDFAGAMAINTGLVVRNGSQFFNKVCSGNETLIWTVSNGWSCSAVVLSESDPKVGANSTNYLSKWNGSALVASGVYESSGNVGIGTTSPTSILQVRDASASPALTVGPSTAANANAVLSLQSRAGGITNEAQIIANWTGELQMKPQAGQDTVIYSGGGSQLMTVKNSGNVGIGTTSPSEKLEVAGNIKATQLCIGADCRNIWPSAGGSGTVTSVGSGTGLTGGPITGTGTLNVDVGTTAGKIIQVAAGNKLPAIDGSDLTNLNASNLSAGTLPPGRLPALTGDVISTAGSNSITLNTVPISKGGTGQTTVTAALNALLPSQGSNSGRFLQTDGTNATWVAQTESDPKIGTNSTNYLSKWDGAALVSSGVYESGGNVGIGTTTPTAKLHIAGTAGVDGLRFPDGTLQTTASVGGGGGADAGSTCGMRSAYCDTGTPMYLAGNNVTCKGNSLAAVCSWNTVASVSGCPTGYTGKVIGTSPGSAISILTCALDNGTIPGGVNYWTANGTDIYSNNTGNVGIGTTSPAVKLDVNGAVRPLAAVLGAACTPLGAQSYNSSSGAPMYCNGSVWTAVGGGGISATTTATCSFNQNACTATCPGGYYRTGCNVSFGYAVIAYPNGSNGCYGGDPSAVGYSGTVYAICAK